MAKKFVFSPLFLERNTMLKVLKCKFFLVAQSWKVAQHQKPSHLSWKMEQIYRGNSWNLLEFHFPKMVASLKKSYFFSEIFRAPFNGQFLKAISADIFRNLQTLRGSQKKKVLKMGKSAEACNFTKSNTPPWMFCIFLKLYKWYQIV